MEENPDDLLVREEPVIVEPPRRGCSCFTGGMYMLFLFAGLCVVGGTLLEHYIKNQHLKSMTPWERTAFTTWLAGTVDVPAEVMEMPETPSAETLEAKQRLFRDAELEYRRWRPITDNTIEPRHSIVDIMESSGPLTTEQLALVTTVTAGFSPLLKRAQELVARSDYMLHDQGYPVLHESTVGSRRLISMCSIYGFYNLESGNPRAVGQVVDVLMEITRSGPAPGYFAALAPLSGARHAVELATESLERTTDTVALEDLLVVMNRHVSRLAGFGQEYNFLGDGIAIRRQMLVDGYINNVSFVRRDLAVTPYEEKKYLEWLTRHLPSTDDRHDLVEQQLKEYMHYGGDFLPKPLRKYGHYPPFSLVGNIIERASMDIQRNWIRESSQTQYKHWAALTNDFNRARLQLAGRIAELRGEPLPTSPEDFVPRYLPEYPLDVTTSAPLPLSALASDPRKQSR